MRIGVLGINHKSTELKFREKLAKASLRLFPNETIPQNNFCYVLLSTCNRIEIYFTSSNLSQTFFYLLNLLRSELEEECTQKIYSYFGSNCFLHLCRVTAGMDSAIVGETEIQGQVKRAYEEARHHRFLSKELHFIFQKSLKIGKDFRSLIQPLAQNFSLGESIEQMAYQVLQELKTRTILFVGYSVVNRKIFTYLSNKKYQNISFCNRSYEKILLFAREHGVTLMPWERLQEEWSYYDLIIFGTKSSDFLLTPHDCQGEIRERKLLIDLSVPRNVDPLCGDHPKVTLLNIDELEKAMIKKRGSDCSESVRMEMYLIARAVEKQVDIFESKQTWPSFSKIEEIMISHYIQFEPVF